MRRVGHKGADAIEPGNTITGFHAAAELGVDQIEFDVLWLPDGRPEMPSGDRSPLVVAHDWHAAEAGDPPTLTDVLAAFAEPPLDGISPHLDIKLPGREDEIVAAVRSAGLAERASVSSMELSTLGAIGELEPAIVRGWTIPKATRPWDRIWWARPFLPVAFALGRAHAPRNIRALAPRLGVAELWIHHLLVTPGVLAAARQAGCSAIAWTVDEPDRIAELTALGVDGICTNDPRLLAAAT